MPVSNQRERIIEILKMIDEFMVRPDYSEWNTRSFLEQIKRHLGELIKP